MKEYPIHMGPDELLIKLLAGEATEQESQEANTWINASPENKAYFESLQKTWASIATLEAEDLKEVDQAWTKFRGRTQPKVQPLWTLYRRVAAVLLVGVALAVTLYFVNQATRIDSFKQIVNQTQAPLEQELPDGSMVYLKPQASIKYQELFAQDERHVLLEGEAFFEVDKDPERPFVVETAQTEIRVLGTSFLVKASAQQAETAVIVSTGVVSFVPKGKPKAALRLTEGKGANYSHTSERPTEIASPELNDVAWATRKFVFDKTPIAEVARILSQAYGIKINLANDAVTNCEYIGGFEDQSIEEIMAIIGGTSPYEVKNEGRNYIIGGTACK